MKSTDIQLFVLFIFEEDLILYIKMPNNFIVIRHFDIRELFRLNHNFVIRIKTGYFTR